MEVQLPLQRDEAAPINYFPEPELDKFETKDEPILVEAPKKTTLKITTLTVKELKKIASKQGLKGYSRMSKQQLKEELSDYLPIYEVV